MKRLVKFLSMVFDSLPTVASLERSLHDRSATRCNNIRGLLFHLCDRDEAMHTWIMRWIAYQLRNPGAKMTTAIVVNGRNFGKTAFFEDVLQGLFGTHAYVMMANELHDRFTRWAVAPRSLIIVHGSFQRTEAARLRAFVTAESVVIDRRGKAPETRPNHLNFVYLSNRGDFLPDDAGGRRFVVVEVPPDWPRRFHEAVHHEIKNGGIDAFHDYLMNHLDLGTFNESTQAPQPKIHRAEEAA